MPAFEVLPEAVKFAVTVASAVAPDETFRISLPLPRSVIVSVPEVTLKMSAPALPVRLSLPAPPVIESMPAVPTMLSAPVVPVMTMVPLLFTV